MPHRTLRITAYESNSLSLQKQFVMSSGILKQIEDSSLPTRAKDDVSTWTLRMVFSNAPLVKYRHFLSKDIAAFVGKRSIFIESFQATTFAFPEINPYGSPAQPRSCAQTHEALVDPNSQGCLPCRSS